MATKRRLIFSLLYSDGYFCQSRNFRCQKVGDFDWLFNNYNFSKIAEFLDELVLLNVNPKPEYENEFLKTVKKIVKNIFIPVAVGGGINSAGKAITYLNSGADKVILNSLIKKDRKEVSSIISLLGSQSVIASIDYKKVNNNLYVFNWENKNIEDNIKLISFINDCHELQFGEIMLNSVEKDGTGFGLDIDIIKSISAQCKLPLIVMGGAGKCDHFLPAYNISAVDAVVTANLLNFIGDALPDTRISLLDYGVDLARFSHQ